MAEEKQMDPEAAIRRRLHELSLSPEPEPPKQIPTQHTIRLTNVSVAFSTKFITSIFRRFGAIQTISCDPGGFTCTYDSPYAARSALWALDQVKVGDGPRWSVAYHDTPPPSPRAPPAPPGPRVYPIPPRRDETQDYVLEVHMDMETVRKAYAKHDAAQAAIHKEYEPQIQQHPPGSARANELDRYRYIQCCMATDQHHRDIKQLALQQAWR